MPRFLLESPVRGFVQALFATVVGAHENARYLLSYEPSAPAVNSASGSPLARDCFYWVMRWLTHIREYSLTNDMFQKQLLEPARCTARFKIEMESATNINALVFSKSESFYDKFHEGKVSTLSLIVPSLECSMSIRCSENISSNLTYGLYEFGGVQPLPYVNRIHPVRLSLRDAGAVPRLRDLGFLKVAVSDLLLFSHTLALENFCEIQSIQFGGRRLGAPCIVSGRLVSARMPQLMLQSLSHPDVSVQMLATSHLLGNMGCDSKKIESLEGQYVRALCSVWYTCGRKEESHYPEAFYIEPVSDRSELLWDEITGEARLHGSCSSETVERLLQGPIEKSMIPQALSIETDGSLRWASRQATSDRITDMFLREARRIRELRRLLGEGEGSAVVFARHRILDLAKLRRSMLAQRLIADQVLNDCLTDLLGRQDSEGQIGRSFSAVLRFYSEPNQETLREKLWWLRDFGFLARTRTGMQITERGLEVAYLAMRTSIIRLARDSLSTYEHDAAHLGELASVARMPPSLLLRALRELEDGWLQCLTIGGRRCELIWIVRSDGEREIGMRKLKAMQSRVLKVLGRVHYALATSKILDEFRTDGMTHFVLALLLSEMKSQAVLTEPDDCMWLYPWEKRIEDILSQDPHPVLDTDELREAASIPNVEKASMLQILNRLEDRRIIRELEKERWAIESSDETIRRDQLLWLFRDECKEYILNDVRTQGGWVQLDRLLSDARLFLGKRMEPFGRCDEIETKVFENCMRDLQKEGKLATAGTIVRLVRKSST